MFPTSIYTSADEYILEENLIEEIKSYKKKVNPQVKKDASDYADHSNSLGIDWVNKLENDDGWNGVSLNTKILEEENLFNLKGWICEHIDHYIHNILNIDDRVEFFITQSWITYGNKGSSISRHFHLNSVLSGCFYVNGENSSINFFSPNGVHPFPGFDFGIERYDILNSSRWKLPVQNNKLVMFPSYIRHSVDPVVDDTQRISLAFNTFFKGSAGQNDSLTLLEL